MGSGAYQDMAPAIKASTRLAIQTRPMPKPNASTFRCVLNACIDHL